MLSFFKRKYVNLTTDKKFSEVLAGSVYAMAARVLATAISMVTSVIVARVYGVQAMGVLALVNSFLLLVTIFTVMGTGTSILRFIPEHIAKYSASSAYYVYRKVQYFVASVSLVTGTTFFFASGFIATRIYSKPHLSFFFALSAVFVIFKSLMDLNTQAVRGLRLNRIFALIQIIPTLTMLMVLVVVTFFSHNQNNPVYAQLTAFTITAITGALIMNRVFKRRMHPEDIIKPMAIREILTISTPMLMTASLVFFVGQTGVVILAIFRPESEVGYYSIAVKLATLTAFALQAINSMAASKFSELYHTGKMDELFHVARKSTKLIFWTTVPVLLVLLFIGKPILVFLYGRDFAVAYPAMSLLVIGQFVTSISGSTGYFMNMTGDQNIIRNFVLIAAILNISLSLVLVKSFGINGVAFAGMISLVTWNLCALIHIKKKYRRTIAYIPIVQLE